MKKMIVGVMAVSLSVMASAQQKPKTPVKSTPGKTTQQKPKTPVTPQPAMRTAVDSLSYALGLSLAQFYKQQGVKAVNTVWVSKAINDAMKGSRPLMTEEQMNMCITNFMQNMKDEKSSGNKKAGEAFLAANKTKPAVVTLPSGLQYLIIQEGNGPKPSINDTVRCHYHGTLIDGTVFDSSVDRGQPAEFPVGGVIKGWVEALPLMPVGSKWRLFIPSDLAYGDNQAGQKIGPGSTLIFDVELLDIVNKR